MLTFNRVHGDPIEIQDERVLIDWYPADSDCYAIHNEYGILAVVFQANEQDALDAAFDAGLLDSFIVEESDLASMTEEERNELTPLGNAGELCDLSYAGIWLLLKLRQQPVDTIIAVCLASGAGNTTVAR